MYIQVLTFHLSDDPSADALEHCRTASLGLAEFDGFVSVTPVAPVRRGSASSMIVWRDWKAVEAFRHSELYARLQMNPHFDAVEDRAFGITDGGAAAPPSELLAVA
ncbi:MAG: hypothetical protein ACRDHF_15560 [Tepidiformaceae bacterium]